MNNEPTVKPLTEEQQLEWEIEFWKELKEEAIEHLEEAEEKLAKVKEKQSEGVK